MRIRRRGFMATLAGVVAGVAAAPARADGDQSAPALRGHKGSDYLNVDTTHGFEAIEFEPAPWTGRLYYNPATDQIMVSANGGEWLPIAGAEEPKGTLNYDPKTGSFAWED